MPRNECSLFIFRRLGTARTAYDRIHEKAGAGLRGKLDVAPARMEAG